MNSLYSVMSRPESRRPRLKAGIMLARIASAIGSKLIKGVPARVEAQLNIRAEVATDPSLLPNQDAATASNRDLARIEGRLDSLAAKVDIADLRAEMRAMRWITVFLGAGLAALVVALWFLEA